MKKNRTKIRPWCPSCGTLMVTYDQNDVDHVLATAPESTWQQVVHSPDLLLLAYIALQSRDGPALAATLQLAGMRLRGRRS